MSTVRSGSILFLPLVMLLASCERSEPPPAPAVATEAAPVAACTVKMGWDPWEPYHFEDVDGSVRGMEIDLVNAIAEGAGCSVEFERGQWDVLLRGLMTGSIDVLGGATATSEREDFARFSTPYRAESFRLYVRAGDSATYAGDTLSDVLANGMRVGVTQGYVYGEDVSELQDNEDFEDMFIEGAEASINFVALVENQVDGVLEDPHVAAALLRRRGWQDRIEAHPLDLGSNEVSLMFSRTSVDEEVVERFNRSLKALRESGELDSIIGRYRID